MEERTVKRSYIQDDDRAKIEVRIAFERIPPDDRETSLLAVGRHRRRHRSKLVKVNENIAIEVDVTLAGGTQHLVLSAVEFQAMVSAVMRILPRERRRYGAIDDDDELDDLLLADGALVPGRV